MRHTALRYLIASQASLVSGLLICFLLEPAVVAGPKGFSNYGVATPTIIPYTLAFVLASLFAALAARRLIPNTHRIILLKRGLFILAALYLAVLISTYPYQSAQWLRALHITTGTTLFSWQILFAGWLLTTSKRNCINCILFAALLAGSLFSLLSLLEVTYILSEAQAVTILAFAILLIRCCYKYETGVTS